MTKKSDSRLKRDALEQRRIQAAEEKRAAEKQAAEYVNDPIGAMAQQELAKIEEQEAKEDAEAAAIGDTLWRDLEDVYQQAKLAVPRVAFEIGKLSDRAILQHMVDPQGYAGRIRILTADCTRLVQELEEIHALHAHRLDDKSGPRETFAAMAISEHYIAWQQKIDGILSPTVAELSALYDEATRRKMAADQKAAEQAAQDAANGVSTVEYTEVPQEEVRAGYAAVEEQTQANLSTLGIDPALTEERIEVQETDAGTVTASVAATETATQE